MNPKQRRALKDLLELEREPVALRWLTRPPDNLPRLETKARFCAKLGLALQGRAFFAGLDEEECMGGAKYCGLHDPAEQPSARRTGQFLVHMGVYHNIPAVQRAWRHYLAIEPGLFQGLAFAPLAEAPFDPDVIFILADARQGMLLLHANAYDGGSRATGGDAAPICSSMAAVPYLTGKLTYGFGDIGSRNAMQLGPDGVMLSIPGSDGARIVQNLERMLAHKTFRRD